ncbi:hypothetical protein MO867_09520 [Microbulbifer sp. OS29]|uniref:MFS transporter n=1 Tax=Microbulbifer okhotskensis TaxID=2926617 RepID=A0A9X2J7K5_9GAMM|nr:hypothetical protein [Microbulbifer okhotskensis]MCO1334576.1 hypothetical protein [Microbulbifer okhotskensis]
MDIANKSRTLTPGTGHVQPPKPSSASDEPKVWRSLWITLPALFGALVVWLIWSQMSRQGLSGDYRFELVSQFAYLAEVGFLAAVLWLPSSYFLQRFGWRKSLIFALLVCGALAVYLYRIRFYTQRVEWWGLLLAAYGNCLFAYLCFGPGRFVKTSVGQEKIGLFGALFKMGGLLWLGLLLAFSVGIFFLAQEGGLTAWLRAPLHWLEAQVEFFGWRQPVISFGVMQALGLLIAGPYFVAVWRFLATKESRYRLYDSGRSGTVSREAWLMGALYGIIFASFTGLLSVSAMLFKALFEYQHYFRGDIRLGHAMNSEVNSLSIFSIALLGLPAALLARALGGWLAKRFGGSWITLACLIVMGWAAFSGGNLVQVAFDAENPQVVLSPLTWRIVLLFMALGGASGGLVHSLLGTFSPLQLRSLWTWGTALGAFGAFYMPLLFALQFSANDPAWAMYGLAILYGLCFVVYAIFCLRKRALLRRA